MNGSVIRGHLMLRRLDSKTNLPSQKYVFFGRRYQDDYYTRIRDKQCQFLFIVGVNCPVKTQMMRNDHIVFQ